MARGLDVIASFGPQRPQMSLSDVAEATDLARPTARRLLLTLEELGYVRSRDGVFSLTPRVLALGTAYVSSLGLWEIARPADLAYGIGFNPCRAVGNAGVLREPVVSLPG